MFKPFLVDRYRVRRYFNCLDASIDRGTRWGVFEPNGELANFLYQDWRTGRLAGSCPEEAFFVRCDRSTMTQNEIDLGRLICEIGVAPLRPAEFVILRIGQKTSNS